MGNGSESLPTAARESCAKAWEVKAIENTIDKNQHMTNPT
jgi:hypothetical protein